MIGKRFIGGFLLVYSETSDVPSIFAWGLVAEEQPHRRTGTAGPTFRREDGVLNGADGGIRLPRTRGTSAMAKGCAEPWFFKAKGSYGFGGEKP